MEYQGILEYLFSMVRLLGNWGYLVFFLAAFLESSAFMGLLVPGETTVVLAGFLSAHGYFEVANCILLIWAGAVMGDSVGYALGRKLGRGYFERHKRLFFFKRKHIAKVDAYFEAHGGKTVFFGKFVGIFRALAPFVAGMSRMPYGRFLRFNVPGGILWAASFTLLGYFFGESWRAVEKWTGRAGLFFFFLLLLLVGLSYIYRKLAKNQVAFYRWARDRYNAFLLWSGIGLFLERHPGLRGLLPERYLALHFITGFGASVLFVIASSAIRAWLLQSPLFLRMEGALLSQILYFESPTVDRFMGLFLLLGSREAIAGGCVLLGSYLILRRRFVLFIGFLAAVIGANFLGALSDQIERGFVLDPYFFAFAGLPAGHAITGVVFYGMAAYIIILARAFWPVRVLSALAALFLLFLLGLGQLYLRLYYPGQLLLAYAAGLIYLAFCVSGLEILRRKRIKAKAEFE